MPRRVAVTGIGLVTPLGIGREETWKGLLAGRSGISPITRFDTAQFSTRFAGEVKGFDPLRWMTSREIKSSLADLFLQYTVAAGTLAMEDAGLVLDEVTGLRAGCYIGSGMGGLSAIESTHKALLSKGPRHAISPFFVTQLIINMAAGQLSIRLGAKGPTYSQVSACSSGAHAIGDAFRLIQRDEVDVMVCGGSEAVITPLGIGGFCAMRALSTRNDAPQEACRPFEADRDGFVMAEGAGILVLEAWDTAVLRGARIYAELKGYGSTADAHHMTAPPPGGEGAARCMQATLKDAGLSPSDIGYINAHGTSTRMNDVAETLAIKQVFQEHAKLLAVSSTKSMTGHLLGAAGGVEAAFSALAVHHGQIPPTINYVKPDPDCDLDYVPNQAREIPLQFALTNSFGFGGTNACLIFGRADIRQ